MKRIVILASFAMLGGCALTDASLDVGHDAEVVQQGPLSETESVTFTPGALEDLRADKDRIGYKTNGFGMKTADIATDEPVTDVIMNAIVHAFESNGHVRGDDGVRIDGTINNFWVETDTNFWSIEVIGNVEALLTFVDPASGASIYERTYSGSYSDKRQMVTENAYNEAISGAVQSLIDDVIFDEQLAEALAAR